MARWWSARSRTTTPMPSASTRRPASSRTLCRTGSLIRPRWSAPRCRMQPRLQGYSSPLRRWSPRDRRRSRRCLPCPVAAWVVWIIDRANGAAPAVCTENWIRLDARQRLGNPCHLMIEFLRLILHIMVSFFKPRTKLVAEILILRQQLNVLRRQVSKRPQLSNTDRLLFVWLYRWFPSVLSAIAILRPETIIRWHRAGFQSYWRERSRKPVGRPRSSPSCAILSAR